jgi:hypothetical protein
MLWVHQLITTVETMGGQEATPKLCQIHAFIHRLAANHALTALLLYLLAQSMEAFSRAIQDLERNRSMMVLSTVHVDGQRKSMDNWI